MFTSEVFKEVKDGFRGQNKTMENINLELIHNPVIQEHSLLIYGTILKVPVETF